MAEESRADTRAPPEGRMRKAFWIASGELADNPETIHECVGKLKAARRSGDKDGVAYWCIVFQRVLVEWDMRAHQSPTAAEAEMLRLCGRYGKPLGEE